MNKLDCLQSIATIALLCAPALAQQTASATKASTPAPPAAKEWSFYASALGYLIPEDRSYVSPVLTADRRSLHVEARYNYENLATGSLWLGRNFSFGRELTLEITPMIGGVFGRSNGVAPGYLLSVNYRRLTLDSQSEYLFETDRSESFFYNWSELSYSPAEWLRAGFVVQRTKAYETKLDIQRGLLVGFSHKNADFTTYVFNLGWTDPTTVFAIGIRF
jgi:hypothetical protein